MGSRSRRRCGCVVGAGLVSMLAAGPHTVDAFCSAGGALQRPQSRAAERQRLDYMPLILRWRHREFTVEAGGASAATVARLTGAGWVALSGVPALCRWALKRRKCVARFAKGFGDVAPPAPPVEVVQLKPGVYAASTKIRLRSAPDVKSEPTGDAVKAGECFEVTEVRPPRNAKGIGYLKVGERGWVFDRGVSGEWLGQAIVTRVPEEEQETYLEVFRDPQAYAGYREIMAQPDYQERLQAKLEAAMEEEKKKGTDFGLADERVKEQLRSWANDPDKKAKLAEWEKWMDNPESSPEMQQRFEDLKSKLDLEEQAQDLKAMNDMAEATGNPEKPRRFATVQDKVNDIVENDPEFKDIKEARDDADRMTGPVSPVAPKWVKLTDEKAKTDEERAAEEAWKRKKKQILMPPGGERALRRKPRAWGRRMGIRVPAVCSPL